MIDPAVILERAAAAFGTTVEALIGPRRFKRLTAPRQAAAWALRQIGLTLMEIGEILHRDHTTIIASIEQAERRAAADKEYALILKVLISQPVPRSAVATPERRPAQSQALHRYKLALTL